ncbi:MULTISPECIES: MgtC/SapB family protein [unclassified Paenibacillus]|uniref:MgtC/SapB family protein n=1 Tax=unclassified Paenibacillus TaxID=185978 RepID=UPI000954A89B|nr:MULTISPECIES: MgtC/SapB family protein [unclassified Paenibacillus]ASS67568.1 MgtC/SapB family protein [Paenibacillus sp. RUD330]SIQ72521.1 putative Mg2+ transporter-C (MgtC) family protein [Paenibacillus sp. RU4X]SIQ94000.1 putative Mg2+ transporter-C (MgtC) family protein [Paenibacillus sp. RU4T]
MEYGFLLRVVLAGVCGAFIGYERKNRMKEAGIRTHFVVAVGAALMVLISKYGFGDVIGKNGIALDPSRIAAQVVSGVGFLGAGMIFMQRQTVKGLTTAAGIWSTAGIGMAIGAGLYIVGAGTTILILIAQKLLHSKIKVLKTPRTEQLTIRLNNEIGAMDSVQSFLNEKEITVLHFHTEKVKESSELLLEMTLKLPGNCDAEQLLPLIQQSPFVTDVEFQ